MMTALRPAALAALMTASLPAAAAAAPVTAQAIEAASYQGGALPGGQAALTVKVQVLLDRAGISPGVIDGIKGGMSRSAIAAFERRSGLPADGVMDPQVWAALQPFAGGAMTMDYTITEADAAELTQSIPTDYLEKANMTTLGYTSVAEKLGERFHMDDGFVTALNPGVALSPGTTIKVIAPSKPLKAKVARIFVEKGTNRVAAYDSEGHMVVNYPATIGSAQTPSPSGSHKVRTVALNPEYTYNPRVNFTQGENTQVLTLPPGPNGPVGSVWIALSKPTYGLHGTPNPERLFRGESHGCVRLTNWDAEELAHMVQPGVTAVEFLERGTTLADVMGEAKGVSQAVQAAASAASAVTNPASAGSLTLAASTAPPRRPSVPSVPAGTAAAPPSAPTVASEVSGAETVATGTATDATAVEAPATAASATGNADAPAAPAALSSPETAPADPLTAAVEAATSDVPDVDVREPATAAPASGADAERSRFVLPQPGQAVPPAATAGD
ncbi:L,D-transpeptidase family protein [Paracoccus sediminicola]|uniref:L,D-transpeptidase family protein n=1 Tax=Paracoccus sediminicola TaxID=3017783 RepID=UPI0022F13110|nr:L,D-transpeptidase family protein [Paracoccus sediminicola]WBU56928.1 L,D-transpeptidase family protein [Paracoccus sediminicola]